LNDQRRRLAAAAHGRTADASARASRDAALRGGNFRETAVFALFGLEPLRGQHGAATARLATRLRAALQNAAQP
jgi:hypothetical protein